MNQDQKRKLENQLLTMGLARLNDPELIQQLADLVSGWQGDRDEFFQDLLNECDADKRYEMYSAMAPKLGFKARSYMEYETSIQMRASEMVSQRRARVEGKSPRPINIGNQRPEDERASAFLICNTCKRKSKFFGETPVSAVIKARQAGWVKTPGIDEESCPKCVKKAKKTPAPASRVLMRVGHA